MLEKIFRRDSEKEEKTEATEAPEEFDFDFSVLWQDEEKSTLLQWLLPAITIVLLLIILIKK